MAKHKFTEEHQPGEANRGRRGKDKRTLILNAIRLAANDRFGITEDSTLEETELAWFQMFADAALDVENANRGLCLQALMDRGWAKLKPSAEMVLFDYDKLSTPLDNVNKILKSVSNGELQPDVAKDLIGAVKDLIAINEHTELLERIKNIEDKLK